MVATAAEVGLEISCKQALPGSPSGEGLPKHHRPLLDSGDAGGEGIEFRSLAEPWVDLTTAHGQLIFNMFAALAECERSGLSKRTRAGLDAAKSRGRKGGRPRSMTQQKRKRPGCCARRAKHSEKLLPLSASASPRWPGHWGQRHLVRRPIWIQQSSLNAGNRQPWAPTGAFSTNRSRSSRAVVQDQLANDH